MKKLHFELFIFWVVFIKIFFVKSAAVLNVTEEYYYDIDEWNISSTMETITMTTATTTTLSYNLSHVTKDTDIIKPPVVANGKETLIQLLPDKLYLNFTPVSSYIQMSVILFDSTKFSEDGSLIIGFEDGNDEFVDLIYIWGIVNNQGKFLFREIQDAYFDKSSSTQGTDIEQDWILAKDEKNENVIVSFTRPWLTCDPFDIQFNMHDLNIWWKWENDSGTEEKSIEHQMDSDNFTNQEYNPITMGNKTTKSFTNDYNGPFLFSVEQLLHNFTTFVIKDCSDNANEVECSKQQYIELKSSFIYEVSEKNVRNSTDSCEPEAESEKPKKSLLSSKGESKEKSCAQSHVLTSLRNVISGFMSIVIVTNMHYKYI